MCRYPYMSPFATVRPDDREVVRGAMVDTATTALPTGGWTPSAAASGRRSISRPRLAQGADIWLLDEPTTFLDYHHQADILSLVALANRDSA